MSTKFAKDQVVKVKGVIPQGPVEKLRMDEEGKFYYLISWKDANDVQHQRWFDEDDLIAG